MTNPESENIVASVAERVREALVEAEKRGDEFVAEAERQAKEIVAEAEGRAARIVAEAEGKAERAVALAEREARERVDRARKALEELGVALSGDAPPVHEAEDPVPEEPPADELEPDELEPELEEVEAPSTQPVPGPEPIAPEELDAGAEPEGGEELEGDEGPRGGEELEARESPGSSPSTEDLIAQLRAGASDAAANTGGDAAARLVAMNMALDGASREEIDAHLADNFDVADREELLDQVLSRVQA